MAEGKDQEDLIHELEEEYKTLPGFRVGFSQPMIDGVMDKIAGAHSELVVKVYGEDFRETRRIAEEITRALGTVKGAVDLDIDQGTSITSTANHYESGCDCPIWAERV